MDEAVIADIAVHLIYAVMFPSLLLGVLVGAFFGWSFRPSRKAVRHDA